MVTRKHSKHLIMIAAILAMLAALPAFAAGGDKSTVKGLITAIEGNKITVKDANNAEQTFTVSSNTVYKKRQGPTGVINEKVQQSALIPGLPITADLASEGRGLQATAISFGSEDFRTAQQLQAGRSPTSSRVEGMAQGMDEFGTHEALATADVHFASGSTALSAKDKSDLMAIAKKAKDTENYAIVLQGFTDSTGSVAANQKLSTMRAAAVANFLQQEAGLAPGRVQSPDGMGIAADAGAGNNANARKVVVKLVVDKDVNAGK